MKRRRNGEGSYFRKSDGSYVYSCRYIDSLTGKKKRKYIRAKTIEALDIKVCEWKKQLELEKLSDNLTVADWCKHFLADVKLAVKTKTYTSYESVIRNHIVPAIGAMRLDNLKLAQVQMMLNRLSEKGLSAETVATVRRILCIVLNRAVVYELIDRNPAKASRAPRIDEKPPVVLNKEDVRRLLEYASDSRFLPDTDDETALYLRRCYYGCVLLSVDSGVRQGELRALQWGDLQGNKIYVNRAMEGNKIGTPKTKTSYRGITLSQTTLEMLREWRAFQERYCAKWGYWTVSEKSFIFTNGKGNPIDVQNLGKRWWRPLLKAAGMPKGTHWHTLRATMSSLLLVVLPVKVVSERLGHSSVNVTLTKYAGILRGIEERSAVVMDGILSRTIDSPTVDVVPVVDGESSGDS